MYICSYKYLRYASKYLPPLSLSLSTVRAVKCITSRFVLNVSVGTQFYFLCSGVERAVFVLQGGRRGEASFSLRLDARTFSCFVLDSFLFGPRS